MGVELVVVGGCWWQWTKQEGGGDRKGVRGFGVNGLIDWSSPVHLLLFINKPGGVDGAL